MVLTTIDVTGPSSEGLGALEYKTHPRIGEWVAIEDSEHQAIMFQVVAVEHSSSGAGSDLYVRRLGPSAEVVGSLLHPR